jgi:hypothetical protein
MQDQVDKRKCVALCWTACTSRSIKDNVDVLFWTGRRQCGCLFWTVCRNRWKEENVAAYFGVYFRIKLIEDNVDVLQDLHGLKTMWTGFTCAEDNVDILQELHMLKIATYAGLSKRCFVT